MWREVDRDMGPNKCDEGCPSLSINTLLIVMTPVSLLVDGDNDDDRPLK